MEPEWRDLPASNTTVRLEFNVDREYARQFKVMVAAAGISIQDALVEAVDAWMSGHPEFDPVLKALDEVQFPQK
jgi:hypothetical protein